MSGLEDRLPLPMVNPNRRFAMFTNGKCGGTSLTIWFFNTLDFPQTARTPIIATKNYGLHFARETVMQRKPRFPLPEMDLTSDLTYLRRFARFFRSEYSAHMLTKIQQPDWYKFAIVRDPYARLVSGYVDKLCGKDLTTKWVQRVVQAVNAKANKDTVTFEEFVAYLESNDNDTVNGHWRRQSFSFELYEIDAFVRIEHLLDDLRPVCERVGVECDEELLGTRRQTNPYGKQLDLSPNEVARMTNRQLIELKEKTGQFPQKDAFYTPELRARVAKIYERDFELLPYEA